MKKMMSVVLAIVVVLSLLAACSSKEKSDSVSESEVSGSAKITGSVEASESEDNVAKAAEDNDDTVETASDFVVAYPLEGDNLELSMWVSVFMGSPYEEHPVFVAAEEATGVHITFVETNPGAEAENFQLTISANDYPDIFRGLDNFYTGGASAAINDEIIYDLEPYLAEYAPDYWALLNSDAYASAIKDSYDDEGRIGCMYQMYSNPDYLSQGLMFRADWLEELGMDVPTTIEENYQYLKAIKETYGCTNALYMNDEMQYTELANAYGVAGYTLSAVGSSGSEFYQVDGVAKASFNEEGFQKYLTTLNQWYNEGIINADFISNQSGTMTEYLYAAGNDCGRYNAVQITQLTTLYETAEADGIEGYELVPGTFMVEEEGDTYHFKESTTFNTNICVTTECENIELALNWLNYFSTEEGILLCNYGVEGETWEYDTNGEPVYTEMFTDNPEYTVNQAIECLCMPQLCTQLIVDRVDYIYGDLGQEAIALWSSSENGDSAYLLPDGMSFNTEEQEVITANLSDIETYAATCIPQFIMGILDPEADWDEFVSNVESMGLQNVLDAYQSCLDRYYAR